MDLKWLQTFIAAAESENFRETAERLYLTQPAVSQHIRKLENELDMRLFIHTGRSVVLTDEGRLFLPYAKDMMNVYNSGRQKVAQWKQGYSRMIRLAVHPYIASYILPRFLPAFIEKQPDMEISTIVAEADDIKKAVEDNKADIGISRNDPNTNSLYYQHICEGTLCLAAPYQETGLANAGAIFSRYRLLTHDHSSTGDDLLRTILVHYPGVQTMSAGQIDAALHMVKAGIGASFLPAYMIKHDQNEKRLITVDIPNIKLPASKTYIMWKRNSGHIRQFHAMLDDFMKREQI
ncbi:LysR family transcriptional regulator [Bacillus sp. HSf4]|uniref:LysR family transcriptional regulator n=1 Tax=Bacillus sp. HSf4 TaxID=3035514 RepID=UPI00240A5D1E|nr:LysR family transcriptional regulator [Bacillus sp. HSf4]WFA04666.1 LysR family transcriptional regulator [Bacillus sp. HSf4]